ncbi:bifunctional DNA-formamidopyrimidine glycosylase/DNA-(apurinic or apyrimidinic site) lyase [Myxococcota bacterium]|nr:bifunctional DNA-formamidopyrimidine glycosylase/DNA-(apurinic or apyrimidinic site) lyase [Myxococcota bacterium]MCZ7620675.1 bifunctional DNA-formamidopyrimidine glycosylase/DNA-(apurinic or apyrimidinic site) lyase [Myxococcota bacterium]
MPELPEVEVTRRRIAPLLLGRSIRTVATTSPSYFFLTPPVRLRRALAGRRAEALERRGKYLIAPLDDGSRLVLHLGMTGQLFSSAVTSPRLLRAAARGGLAPEAQHGFAPDEHTHLRLGFDDAGPEVWMRDARKFGKVLWLAPGASDPRLDRLGPDALTASGAQLFAASRRRRIAIKSLLLDQAVLAGVGNIYADEALHGAGVRPSRAAARVTRVECERLAAALRRVLLRSIETGGSSIRDYIGPDGIDGAYQDERRVYGRTGEPCLVCATPLRRRVIGARSSHFCPRCQR